MFPLQSALKYDSIQSAISYWQKVSGNYLGILEEKGYREGSGLMQKLASGGRILSSDKRIDLALQVKIVGALLIGGLSA